MRIIRIMNLHDYVRVNSCVLQARHTRLEDSVKQFGLFRECDDVESWITEKVYITQVHKLMYSVITYALE